MANASPLFYKCPIYNRSLNQWVLPLPLSMPLLVLPINYGSSDEKWQLWVGNTASGKWLLRPSLFPAQYCHFLLKIAIRWATLKIGSQEVVSASSFKDPALLIYTHLQLPIPWRKLWYKCNNNANVSVSYRWQNISNIVSPLGYTFTHPSIFLQASLFLK